MSINSIDRIKLINKYIVPPFSVLDSKQLYWYQRRDKWNALGFNSSTGRDENLIGGGDSKYNITGHDKFAPDTSVFDPVLADICYSWFVPKGGTVLDPFAGGSTRGLVASHLGLSYVGIDIREEQILANKAQLHLSKDIKPKWILGDSAIILNKYKDQADFIFSCPPYADLEVYSDIQGDISNMPYNEFIQSYEDIIYKSCACLNDNSFACFIVGEVRSKDGSYYGFVPDTIKAFNKAGLKFYNDMILLNEPGTAAMRGGIYIEKSRKVAKTHQNVLVFVKGDARRATERCGDIHIVELGNGDDSQPSLF